ncbi:hypothetical protein JTE90_001835 [Oedothorax gibbosus]|uniref:15-cis-phytoene synthase n=1 Tax=Oedothorax gibbosus TaxID=931172 RepID=A0AAV6U6V0_9ARAC|nr:hypothetical protein JTE90_001835 [Oedothorax gibbosus]
MAASMRLVLNTAEYVIKRVPKYEIGNFTPLLSINKRRLSTKNFDSFKYCIDSVRKYDYENYLCTLLLPEPLRSSAFVIRAFNVEISQVRDSVSNSTIGEMRMQFWKDSVDRIFAGNPPEQPVAQEVAKVLSTVKLSKTWFQRLISSRENLLHDKPFLSTKELENYCDHSVVSVYFLLLQAAGLSNVQCDHAASHVGKSQGISNFLRGIPFNASKRRLFLPLEIMSKHKISQEGLLQGDEKSKLQDAVFEISSLAHEHLLLARQLSKEVSKEARRIFLPLVMDCVTRNFPGK